MLVNFLDSTLLTFLKHPAEVVEPDSNDEPDVAPKRRGRGSKAAAAAKGQLLGSVDNTSGILPGDNEAGEGLLEVRSPRSLRRPVGGVMLGPPGRFAVSQCAVLLALLVAYAVGSLQT